MFWGCGEEAKSDKTKTPFSLTDRREDVAPLKGFSVFSSSKIPLIFPQKTKLMSRNEEKNINAYAVSNDFYVFVAAEISKNASSRIEKSKIIQKNTKENLDADKVQYILEAYRKDHIMTYQSIKFNDKKVSLRDVANRIARGLYGVDIFSEEEISKDPEKHSFFIFSFWIEDVDDATVITMLLSRDDKTRKIPLDIESFMTHSDVFTPIFRDSLVDANRLHY